MLDSLRTSLTQSLNPVHHADSTEELEAIWKFRYRVCVEELNRRDVPQLDHDKAWLKFDSDESENTFIYYTGSKDKITGVVTLRVFDIAQIPDDVKRAYSLGVFKDIDKRKIVEMSSFSYDNTVMAKSAAAALVYKSYELAVEKQGEILFVSCVPDHLQMYQDFGLRPYGAKATSKDSVGLLIPLVGMLDLDYYKEIHSPIYHVLAKLEKDIYCDTEAILEVIYEASGSFESNRDVIKNEILTFFKEFSLQEGQSFSLLSTLPEQVIDRIAESSQIIDIAPEDQVIQEDVRDQELYFLLNGLLEVRKDDQVLMTKRKGDTLGEVGFFRESGKRAASVFAVEKTRLLVVRKSFLKRLVKDHPGDACIFYEALGRVMAEHIAGN